jgi:hypothetical protein
VQVVLELSEWVNQLLSLFPHSTSAPHATAYLGFSTHDPLHTSDHSHFDVALANVTKKKADIGENDVRER